MKKSGGSRFVGLFGSRRGAAMTLAVWLLFLVALGVAAPGAKPYAVNAGEGNADGTNPAAVAQRVLDERFPGSGGMPALLVFHADGELGGEKAAKIEAFSRWLASEDKPAEIAGAIPYHALPEAERSRLYSEDGTTLIFNVEFAPGLESDRVSDAMDELRAYWREYGAEGVRLETTGPAAISADTLRLFRNADFVLMGATVVLILALLVAIYRSPLLAVIPLAVAGIVYSIADKLIGLAGRAGWFVIDKQSLSIMMILLFAVITDYCLFVFSRYRERLAEVDSKYEAMKQAMARASEPILFSGGTVLAAMLVLFAASFQPYRGFAPVFAIAVGVVLLAGLMLIPAVFALFGRQAFRTFRRKTTGEGGTAGSAAPRKRTPFWERTGRYATGKPKRVAAALLALLVLASLSAGTIRYSFNLMKSFPDDTPSRVGFELLEERFPPGRLAPATIVVDGVVSLTGSREDDGRLRALAEKLREAGGVESVSEGEWSKDGSAVRLQAVFDSNPYEPAALDLVDRWRKEARDLLAGSGFDPNQARLLVAGQTAEQADARSLNERDTIVLFVGIALLIGALLTVQTRSPKMSLLMLLTILLSFGAAMGLTWGTFHVLLGYETLSYRIPVYTFVFMVALGIDYNIMLVSRIKEEAAKHPWKEAVSRGVAATGGVISSAGLLLAATFGVLMTQPLQELYVFGFAMAAGILLDTFLVRGWLLPAAFVLAFKDGKPSAGAESRADSGDRSRRIRL